MTKDEWNSGGGLIEQSATREIGMGSERGDDERSHTLLGIYYRREGGQRIKTQGVHVNLYDIPMADGMRTEYA
ncbi:hypothetical protein ACHAWU_009112 [Discostella pseudostelligera]|uniref:Uncharacterized protein n=1 Tax=Discostella pseudostelligera TaxID=259834 RepID=A0ABD3LX95_9STRA